MTLDRTLPDITTHPDGISGQDYSQQVKEETEELWRISADFLVSVSGTDTITANANTTLQSYGSGKGPAFWLVPANTNTGPVTLNVNSLGQQDVVNVSGNPLAGGELVAGRLYLLVYDASGKFRIFNSAATPTSSLWALISSGGGGGTSTGGQDYPFNIEVRNDIAGVSMDLSTSPTYLVTLPAGRYRVRASAQFKNSSDATIRLWNNTDSEYFSEVVGAQASVGGGSGDNLNVQMAGEIVLASAKDVKMRYFVANAQPGTGLGDDGGFSVDNHYGFMEIQRIGEN